MSKKSIVVGLVIFVFLLITGVLTRKNNEDIVRISTKKVMTVYSNENQTITLFTDFNHMEKGSFTNPVKINLNKFNEIALFIALLELISKFILYYFHERIWIRIPLGLKKKNN